MTAGRTLPPDDHDLLLRVAVVTEQQGDDIRDLTARVRGVERFVWAWPATAVGSLVTAVAVVWQLVSH